MPARLALRTVTLLIALAGATAGRAHADAKKDTPMSAVHADKLLAFYDDLVETAVKAAAEPDCKAQAAALDGVVTRHINTIQMMWAAKKTKQSLPPPVKERMDKRSVELVTALRKCWDHEAVTEVFDKMKLPQMDLRAWWFAERAAAFKRLLAATQEQK